MANVQRTHSRNLSSVAITLSAIGLTGNSLIGSANMKLFMAEKKEKGLRHIGEEVLYVIFVCGL